MCDKSFDICFFESDSVPEQNKAQEMCGIVVSEDLF